MSGWVIFLAAVWLVTAAIAAALDCSEAIRADRAGNIRLRRKCVRQAMTEPLWPLWLGRELCRDAAGLGRVARVAAHWIRDAYTVQDTPPLKREPEPVSLSEWHQERLAQMPPHLREIVTARHQEDR